MTGNVNSIVESMFAANSLKNQQNTVSQKNKSSFSDYLNYALLNSQSGALFGSVSGTGLSYPYTSPLSGSVWQAFALKALADGLNKNNQPASIASENGQEQDPQAAGAKTKKPDWAKIRVVRYYQAPQAAEKQNNPGILV